MTGLNHPDGERLQAALLRRRDELMTRSARVDRDLARANDPLAQDFADQVVQTQNDATLSAIGAAAQKEVLQIDRALERIEQGRYGICEQCGQPVAPERLRVAPYATACAACARAAE